MTDLLKLSKRERQIMEAIYARGEASANDVAARVPGAPSATALRTFLRILENKGHVLSRKRGKETVYRPTRPKSRAARPALRWLLETFFGGSLEKAVAAHLAGSAGKTSQEELDRLRKLIERARKKG